MAVVKLYQEIAVMEFTKHEPNTLISFDSMLQNNLIELINYVKNTGNCTKGNGNTNVLDAINEASNLFMDDMRNKKIIVVISTHK